MRVLLFIVMLCLSIFALEDSLWSINLDALEFEFYPCDIKSPIIKLDIAVLKKYTENLMVIKHNDIKYYWKNRSELFRDKTSLGCYELLLVRWNFGYQLFY